MNVSGIAGRWLAAGLVVASLSVVLAEDPIPAGGIDDRIDALFSFIPEAAARINEDTISAKEVKAALHPQFVSMVASGYEPEAEELQQVARNTIDRLINDRILLAACQKAGFEADMPAAWQRIEELEDKVGSDRFEKGLAHQGMSRDDLAAKIAEQAMINAWLFKTLMPEIKVSDDELRQAYEENRDALKVQEQVTASHILFGVKENADDATRKQARKEATETLAAIKAGAEFAEMAEAHSDCPSAQMGGKLGTFGKGRMVPPFEAAAFALKPGEISDVVETEYGYHIILCEAHTDGRDSSFEESKQRLSEFLVQQKLNDKIQGLIGEARKNADIVILIPEP